MIILALHGQQGAGKTTLADRVATHMRALGRRVVVMSFAEPLKRLCWELFGIEYGSHQTQSDKNRATAYGMSAREIWQRVGQAMREIWPDVWALRAVQAAINTPCDVVIFDDLRHPNEADAAHDAGGRVVWLTDTPLGVGSHISDTAMRDYDDFDDVFSPRDVGMDAAILRLVALVHEMGGDQ